MGGREGGVELQHGERAANETFCFQIELPFETPLGIFSIWNTKK